MSSPLLEVKDLQVVVGEENKVLLDGLNLTVNAGETHVLMGHNGAGKSTLMSALMGDPRYTVTRGQIIFRGQDITHETADVRARAGMFLSFQTPEEIPGITLESFPAHGCRCCDRQARQGHEVPPRDGRPDGGPEHGPVLRGPLSERRLLRR